MTPMWTLLAVLAGVFLICLVKTLHNKRKSRKEKDERQVREIKDCIIIMNGRSKSIRERLRKLFKPKLKDSKP